MEQNEITENIRQIKRRFFAMRNGMMGEQMRRAGASYRIIFGLNLPQIAEIAADSPQDVDLAEALWHNTATRESMIIAPMVCPRDKMTLEKAMEWIASATSIEVVDILCHKLLKHLEFAPELAAKLLSEDVEEPLTRYAGIRLMFNTLSKETARCFEPLARAEAQSERPTAGVARMLVDEIEFIASCEDD